MRTFKRILLLLIGIAIVAIGALWLYAAAPTEAHKLAAGADVDVQQLVEQGRYIAIAGDCVACHTAPGGQPFAGGLPLASPIGAIYSSNITPDANTGIGKYSLDDFDRAVRYGIKPDGETLYPAMPYPSYARMSDQDLRALYAYFMHGVQPAVSGNRGTDIQWPLSIRWPLGIWRKRFAPASSVTPINPDKYKDAAVARGAYLVQGLGHCGTCHTPRAFTLQEVALDETQPTYLSGGSVIDGWFAVNLRGNDGAGLGRWSAQDIVDVLKSGRNMHAAVAGAPMGDVVLHSMQDLSEADLLAIAAYLKSLPAAPMDAAHFTPSPDTAKALAAGQESGRGAQLYLDNCAACHRSSGEGSARVFPAIAGNASVLAANPSSLIRLVLGGSAMPSTRAAPSNLGMPGFAWRLSDEEVAQLLTFIRQSWGNSGPGVSAAEVGAIRQAMVARNDIKSATNDDGSQPGK
jgi:mono/diheme cytochrome c family protein